MSGERAQRVGVFGGTFDPVHVGHVVVAAEVRNRLGLDRVLVVPAGDPWQKRGRVVASARDRLALVELAVAEVDGVEASAVEVDREGASVTADTLEALLGPGHELFLVLGADAVANMGTWRRLEETRGWRRSSSWSGKASTPGRPAPAGGSSTCPSHASTSRPPTCAPAWPRAAPSTA